MFRQRFQSDLVVVHNLYITRMWRSLNCKKKIKKTKTKTFVILRKIKEL